MTPERWQKAKELCHLALDREPQQRAAFLAAACADDETLRREVESLIARMTGEGILDAPIFEKLGIDAAVVGALDGAKRSLPAMLGRYRILRLVGEGGMGVVYEAEQDQPRRMVALKVIKPGLTNPELLRRFERESQILARLQHPGIAQIYEAGTADAGFGPQPYFAMEFIHGAPLGEYAESHHLGARQRLELMAKVCDAVEHAHQRGIIHRDLKPGNILVEESGQPKILDFGVARVTDGDAQATRQTDLGQLIGTLAYMSPEQVLADPLELDTRSDVYALGVILYELLAKRLPYEVRRNPNEAIRAIREEDPSRLSAISRDYRGDVETIVAKALEKERARRYSSSAALAADIRRHLADEPITARPASTAYQLRKFARRHRVLVAAAATLGVVLVAGVVVSTREAVRARRAEQTAQAVNDFLRNDLLAQASAENQSGPNTRPDPHLEVRTALDRAAARIAGKFRNDPEVEAAIRDTIGQTYMDLGLFPQSRTQLERALQLERSALGETDPKTVNTLSRLGRTVYLQGKYPEAQALFNQALGLQRRVLGPEHPDTLTTMNGLGAVALAQGKFAQAEEFNSKILEIRRRVLGAEHPSTLASMNNLAVAYERQQKYAQAEELDRKTLEIMSRTLGPEHPRTLVSMISLGIVYLEQGKYVQAEAMLSRDLEIQRRVLGPEHITTLVSMSNLANAYHSQGKYTQAAALSLETLEIRRRVLGAEHANTLVSMDNLAEAYTMLGKYAQAETLLQQALEAGRRVLGPDHGLTLLLLADSASLYQREGKYRLAESNAVQALADYRRVQGAEHPDTMAAVAQLALAYLSQGKFGQAEPLARQAVEFHRRKQPEDWQRFRAESLLGASLSGEKRYAEAEPLLVEGYQGMAARKERIDVPDWYHLDRAREWLVQLYGAWGKPDQAARWRAGQ